MTVSLLVDEKILGKFVDKLIIRKLSGASVSKRFKLLTKRRKLIEALGCKISFTLLSHLTKEQKAELDQLLNSDNLDTRAAVDDFFHQHHINKEQIILEITEQFAEDFLAKEI